MQYIIASASKTKSTGIAIRILQWCAIPHWGWGIDVPPYFIYQCYYNLDSDWRLTVLQEEVLLICNVALVTAR
jgi:hypothetical protein